MTQGKGPDCVIEAVGLESHGPEEGPEAYKTFRDKQDGCIKVVVRPNG